MTISTAKLSAQQFLMLGEDPPGVRLELVHGEISVSPSPSFDHSEVDTYLRIILGNYIIQNDLGKIVGDVDTILDKENVRRPDIIFIAKSRLHLRTKTHGIHFAPDLCIEIISPGSATVDQTDKFALYAKSGVAHYWMVDPANRTFNAFKLSGAQYEKVASAFANEVVSAEPFPGLKIPLSQIWPAEDSN